MLHVLWFHSVIHSAQCAHCVQTLERVAICHGKLRNSTLATLSQHCRSHLKHLDLSYTTGFDDLGLKSFAVYCNQLTSLRIVGCHVTDDGVRAILRACPQLRELCLTDKGVISEASLQHMHEDTLLTREPPDAREAAGLPMGGSASGHASGTASGANALGALHRQPSDVRRIATM